MKIIVDKEFKTFQGSFINKQEMEMVIEFLTSFHNVEYKQQVKEMIKAILIILGICVIIWYIIRANYVYEKVQ